MPFAGSKRAVAVLAEHFTHQGMRFGNGLPALLDMVKRTSRMEHRAAGHADGPAGSAGNVSVGERCPARDQPVDVGCLHRGISQRTDGVETLIIGKKEKHVRPRGRLVHLNLLLLSRIPDLSVTRLAGRVRAHGQHQLASGRNLFKA